LGLLYYDFNGSIIKVLIAVIYTHWVINESFGHSCVFKQLMSMVVDGFCWSWQYIYIYLILSVKVNILPMEQMFYVISHIVELSINDSRVEIIHLTDYVLQFFVRFDMSTSGTWRNDKYWNYLISIFSDEFRDQVCH
jgi:hypothetical protein